MKCRSSDANRSEGGQNEWRKKKQETNAIRWLDEFSVGFFFVCLFVTEFPTE